MNIHKKIAVTSHLNESEVQEILGTGRHLNESNALRKIKRASKAKLEDRQERAMSESLTDRQALVDAIAAVASKTFLNEAQLASIVDRNEDLAFAELTESKLLQLAMSELAEVAGESLGGRINEARRLASKERRNIRLTESERAPGREARRERGYGITRGEIKAINESTQAKRRLAERFESLNEARQARRDGETAETVNLGGYRNSLLESRQALNETALDDNSQVGDDINTIVFGKGDEIKLPVGYTHITVDLDGSVNAYTSKPVYDKDGWVGDSPKRIGRVVWDDHLVAGGSRDPRVIQSAKQEVTAKQIYNIQNGLALTRPFTDAYAFKSWNALAEIEDVVPQAAQVADPTAAAVSHTINESKKPVPAANRFLAIPSHLV